MLSAVYAVVVYLSVCVCVCHTPVLSQNGRFDKILAYDRRTDRQTLTHTHTHTHTHTFTDIDTTTAYTVQA